MADGAVLHAEGAGEQGDGGVPAVAGVAQDGRRSQHGDHAEDDRFRGERDGQPAAGLGGGEGVCGPATGQRADDEAADGGQ